MCIGRGPAYEVDDHGFTSNSIIAGKQYEKAKQLWESNLTSLSGDIQYRHKFVDMTNIAVKESNFTKAGKTCLPAMGMSFAAGTTDGPGAFDFKQGDTHGTLFWRTVGHFLMPPSQYLLDCQAPKPVLLATGETHIPYAWQPTIVDVQILKVGQFIILCVPGEFTTMAGRRLRHAVAEKVKAEWGEVHVVIAGLTNTYSSYVTTREEYGAQRYEGASTIFGPSTLDAYIQEFLELAEEMIDGKEVVEGPKPPNLISKQLSLLPGIILDLTPPGSFFGKVLKDVEAVYAVGEIVKVDFQSACPRNSLRTEETFLTVERQQSAGVWDIIYTDNDTSTKFAWRRPFTFSPTSTATVEWTIPQDTPAGVYRLSHHGNNKKILRGVGEFSGYSSPFYVRQESDFGVSRLSALWWRLRSSLFSSSSD